MTRTWIITGASSGLGYLMTEKLLARGDRVTATARKTSSLDQLKAKHGDQLRVVSLELTDTAAVRSTVDEAVQAMGRIDVVVSNAGYGLFGAAEELTDDEVRQQLDVNVMGSIQVVRAALPHLRDQGSGLIMQVSSEGGQITYPGFSLYHASKWAVEGFIEAVAQEVEPFGVRCTIIEPGPTRTGFRANLVKAKPIAAYEGTRVGTLRASFSTVQSNRSATAGGFGRIGDAEKVAQAMIDTADRDPMPLRVVLGASSYEKIHAAYTGRLKLLEEQRETSVSTDMDA